MGRGQWGKGISGTTIKDTLTKSSGREELGEGWVGGKMETTVLEQQLNKKIID